MKSTVLGAVLVGMLAAACSGTCERLADDYDNAVRQQVALAGTGLSPVSGGFHHIGMTLSHGFLLRVLRQIDDVLEPISRPLVVDESHSGRRTSVRVSASASVDGVEFGDPRHNELRITFDVRVEATVRRVGSRETHFLQGTTVVDGTLRLDLDEEGHHILVVSFDSIEPEDSRLGVHAVRPEIGEAIRQFVEPGMAHLLLDEIGEVTLMHFPPVELQAIDVTLAAVELSLSEADGTVYIGFVTNLRPSSTVELRSKGEIPEGGFRLTLHPGLIAAAARLALQSGGLEDRFNRDAESDPDGPIRVTFGRLDFTSRQVGLDFRVWDLGNGDCWTADVSTGGQVRLQENAVNLVLTDIDAPALADGHSEADASAWLHSDFAGATETLVEEMIGLRDVELGNSERLELTPVALDISSQLIEVDFQPSANEETRARTQ